MNDQLKKIISEYQAEKTVLAEINSDISAMTSSLDNLKEAKAGALERLGQVNSELNGNETNQLFFKRKGLTSVEILARQDEQAKLKNEVQALEVEILKFAEILDGLRIPLDMQRRKVNGIVESYYQLNYTEKSAALSDSCLNELRDFVLALFAGHPNKKGTSLNNYHALIAEELLSKLFNTQPKPDVFDVRTKCRSALDELALSEAA